MSLIIVFSVECTALPNFLFLFYHSILSLLALTHVWRTHSVARWEMLNNRTASLKLSYLEENYRTETKQCKSGGWEGVSSGGDFGEGGITDRPGTIVTSHRIQRIVTRHHTSFGLHSTMMLIPVSPLPSACFTER